MEAPTLKQIENLTPSDFDCHPIWVGVHNNDFGEPWYDQSDEQTYRPWTGPLPFPGKDRFAIFLVATSFCLADGSVYPGYFNPASDDWDLPLQPRRMKDGSYTKPLQWSARRGGSPLSVLALLRPVIFIADRAFGFHLLRDPERRKASVQSFYSAIGKSPNAVFPVRFHADPGYFNGIVAGKMDGFYSFPLDKQPEIDTGESLLNSNGGAISGYQKEQQVGTSAQPTVEVIGKLEMPSGEQVVTPLLKQSPDLSLEDFQRHPVWVRVQNLDANEPWYGLADAFTFRPWTGALPVDAEKVHARIAAVFVLRDGSEFPGYVRAVPEGWPDLLPPPTTTKSGKAHQQESPRSRFGGSQLAIFEQQLPSIFVGHQRFGFWRGLQLDTYEEIRQSFYKAVGKEPDSIFPIRFYGTPGLATGIVTGELNGFYCVKLGALPFKIEC
jgi:hypothetical protein